MKQIKTMNDLADIIRQGREFIFKQEDGELYYATGNIHGLTETIDLIDAGNVYESDRETIIVMDIPRD